MSNSDLKPLAKEFGLVSVRNGEFLKILFTIFLIIEKFNHLRNGRYSIMSPCVPSAQFQELFHNIFSLITPPIVSLPY